MPQVSDDVVVTSAQVLRSCLIDLDLVSFPGEQGEAWYCTIASLPDAPDEIVCISDIAGLVFGKRARDKKNNIHSGILIRIRAKRYDVAFTKGLAIATALDTQMSPTSTVLPEDASGATHQVQNVQRMSSLVYLGEEVGKQRQLFSINARMAFGDTETLIS